MCYGSVFAASFAACAACFSLRAAFRVCHDLPSVFGFGFSFLCDSRLCGVVVVAMYPLSVLSVGHAGVRERAYSVPPRLPPTVLQVNHTGLRRARARSTSRPGHRSACDGRPGPSVTIKGTPTSPRSRHCSLRGRCVHAPSRPHAHGRGRGVTHAPASTRYAREHMTAL